MRTENKMSDNRITDIECLQAKAAIPDTQVQALTRAEMDQIISQNRDKLYRTMQRITVAFAAVSTILMAGFKMNEGFFDASSRIGLLMESVNAQENSLHAPKVNVRTTFVDEAGSRLVIPLKEPIAGEDVHVREEFTQNKYVITLSGYSANIPNRVELVSDSTIMDAVGVYRQNTDVVVEVFCMDLYEYELVNNTNSLTVAFKKPKEDYAASAVIWFPYEDRNRLALPEWKQSIDKFATDNNIKLYMASNMQEEYTQEDVISFANRIQADMVLGVQVDRTDEQQSYMTGICNTVYFVPEYNSAHLSVVMAEAFVEETQIGMRSFEEGDSSHVLVAKATVPSAAMNILLTQKDMESVENEYKLNERIVKALEKTMGNILKDYIRTEEKADES